LSDIKIIGVKNVDYLNTICGRFVSLEFDIMVGDEYITDWFLYDTLNECLVNYTMDPDDIDVDTDFFIRGFYSKEPTPILIMDDITFSEHGKFLDNEMKNNTEFFKKVKSIVVDSMI